MMIPYGNRLIAAIILVVCYIPVSFAQQTANKDGAWVDSLLQALPEDADMDTRMKSDLLDSAFRISIRNNDLCRQIDTRVYQAICLEFIGLSDSAVAQLLWVKNAFRPPCDSLSLLEMYANLTRSLLTVGDLDRVDSLCQYALTLWNPKWKKAEYRSVILNNLAISQFLSGDTLLGTQTFRQIYREAIAANDRKNIRSALINLGTLEGLHGELDSAYYFFTAALDPDLLAQDLVGYMDLQFNIAQVDIQRGRYREASVRLDSLFSMAEKKESIEMMAYTTDARSQIFALTRNYQKAYEYLRDYITLNEKVMSKERMKAVTEMLEKYESEKKARQIKELQVENLDATLKNERIRNTRNRYLFIGAGVFLVAIGLFGRLQYVRRSKAAIQHEKEISEGLLLNILPASVAEELKLKGNAEAKHFDQATILFSDFKGFTTISEHLTPSDLVGELNVCFKAFDEIITRHGIEKIKTIGDSYMAAGSIPDTNTATALEVVKAGIEMQQFVATRRIERDAQGLPAFDMRVGIHSGPVVAGIVGVKKFQYDIWGDTVNIASRMETAGEIGKVNISAVTYGLVHQAPDLSFTPRGMVHVKGKGEMEMYFVDSETVRE